MNKETFNPINPNIRIKYLKLYIYSPLNQISFPCESSGRIVQDNPNPNLTHISSTNLMQYTLIDT